MSDIEQYISDIIDKKFEEKKVITQDDEALKQEVAKIMIELMPSFSQLISKEVKKHLSVLSKFMTEQFEPNKKE